MLNRKLIFIIGVGVIALPAGGALLWAMQQRLKTPETLLPNISSKTMVPSPSKLPAKKIAVALYKKSAPPQVPWYVPHIRSFVNSTVSMNEPEEETIKEIANWKRLMLPLAGLAYWVTKDYKEHLEHKALGKQPPTEGKGQEAYLKSLGGAGYGEAWAMPRLIEQPVESPLVEKFHQKQRERESNKIMNAYLEKISREKVDYSDVL